ncbi:hypothetical protein [Flavobacterium sp. UBA7680]|uniref:Abi-alpha family protein n=1 Tax=Flavobacterium sp. UBA7680 TaxID=1946559 RepID=UPI0025BEA467|nr:hypothetical protein [Flavobacterium sp. UBA7680]
MEKNKIDISSTAIEKGIDLVKDLLDKLVGSSIEETGLLFSDRIKSIRVKYQIKSLVKAQNLIKEHNIKVKPIALKNLVPLLELSSLEEEETLQEKWANMIVNFSDSNSKYESSIYPFILSQISKDEILEIERIKEIKTINEADLKITNIDISNLIRLGLLAREISEGGFVFMDEEIPPIYYSITELGDNFVKCCAIKK